MNVSGIQRKFSNKFHMLSYQVNTYESKIQYIRKFLGEFILLNFADAKFCK